MASKEVKKKVKKNFYLYIYEYIKEEGRLPKTKFSKQKLNYYVRQLKEANIIRSTGYSVWEICGKFSDFKKYKEVKKMNNVTTEYIPKKDRESRGHGFVFNVMFTPKLNWDQREYYWDKLGLVYDKIKQGESIVARGHKVWISETSLTIYFTKGLSFMAKNPDLCYARALMECKETIKEVERLTKTSYRMGKSWAIRESRSHYADIRNELANYYHSRGISNFEIKQYGKTWALVDNSFNLYELETIQGGGKSKEDLPKLQVFLNDLRDNPTTITATKEELTSLILNLAKRTDEIQQQLQAQVMLTNKLTEIIIEKFK